jgi:hypothetical protein
LLAADWQLMEYLDFERTSGLPEVQRRALTFKVSKEGSFAGFVIKMEGTQVQADVESDMYPESAARALQLDMHACKH